MKQLNIATGAETYRLNDCCEVVFNPTDSAFVESLFRTFETLDRKQEAYRGEIERLADKREIFRIARERDKEIRDMIDGLFNAPVCESVFGSMNVYAMADGLPAWCNLMLALMDEIDTSFAREQKAMNPRIKKYTDKYKA